MTDYNFVFFAGFLFGGLFASTFMSALHSKITAYQLKKRKIEKGY